MNLVAFTKCNASETMACGRACSALMDADLFRASSSSHPGTPKGKRNIMRTSKHMFQLVHALLRIRRRNSC